MIKIFNWLFLSKESEALKEIKSIIDTSLNNANITPENKERVIELTRVLPSKELAQASNYINESLIKIIKLKNLKS